MNIDALIEELKADEGYRRFPYKCSSGKLTIGYGRNIDDVGISDKEAEVMLMNDVQFCTAWLDKKYPWFKNLTDARQRALVNMCFNLGVTKFTGFKKMLRAFSIGHYDRAALEASDSRWYYQVGDRARRIVKMIQEG